MFHGAQKLEVRHVERDIYLRLPSQACSYTPSTLANDPLDGTVTQSSFQHPAQLGRRLQRRRHRDDQCLTLLIEGAAHIRHATAEATIPHLRRTIVRPVFFALREAD
jgi:hypothetical protein